MFRQRQDPGAKGTKCSLVPSYGPIHSREREWLNSIYDSIGQSIFSVDTIPYSLLDRELKVNVLVPKVNSHTPTLPSLL